MARPRKPTELHVISGSAQVHPERMRERENEPQIEDDIRDFAAPEHLDQYHRELWGEVSGYLHARVAGEQDLIAFEALVRLVAVMRSGRAVSADFARLQAYLGEFGMTPAARSKVAQGKRSDAPKGFAALRSV